MFRTLWAINTLIGLVALFFFVWGLADGSVSSFNAGLWTMLLAALAANIGGSLWLKSIGWRRLALVLALILAVPGGLYALFLLIVILSGESWN